MTRGVEQRDRSQIAEGPKTPVPQLTDLRYILGPEVVQSFSRLLSFEDCQPGRSIGMYVADARAERSEVTLVFIQESQTLTPGEGPHEISVPSQRTFWKYGVFKNWIPIPQDDKFGERIEKTKDSPTTPLPIMVRRVFSDLKLNQRKAG